MTTDAVERGADALRGTFESFNEDARVVLSAALDGVTDEEVEKVAREIYAHVQGRYRPEWPPDFDATTAMTKDVMRVMARDYITAIRAAFVGDGHDAG